MSPIVTSVLLFAGVPPAASSLILLPSQSRCDGHVATRGPSVTWVTLAANQFEHASQFPRSWPALCVGGRRQPGTPDPARGTNPHDGPPELLNGNSSVRRRNPGLFAGCRSPGLRAATRRGDYSHMRSSPGVRAFGLGRPVWVKLEALFIQQGNGVSREKDDDLVLTGEVPGKLDSWARAGRGEWLGVVSFEVTTRAGDSCTWERQLVPAYALRPRSYGAYPPGSRPRYPSGQIVDPTAEGAAGRLAPPDPVV
jgi:hypothetical protein